MYVNDSVSQTLEDFKNNITKKYDQFIGFPGSVDFDYSEIYPLFDYLLNNVGDPYVEPLHALHSASMEREVIDFFADLFRAPKNNYWGYVTSGGTEGNLYGLYLARETLPKARVFYSESAHYSIPKNTYILKQKTTVVRAQKNGEMDYDDLRRKLKTQKGKPVIVLATIGTTMTEAKDNVAVIRSILQDVQVSESYIHSDAALAGTYTALSKPRYPFDFKDGADSISISGHKFIGSPMACGVVIVRKSNRNRIQRSPAYVGSPDTTITGSRNGHAPIFLWYAIKRWGKEGFLNRYETGSGQAEYAHSELQRVGWQTWRNPGALTVMLASPPRELIYKWQLATYNGWSHIICMPGVTKERIDNFISDLKASR